MSSSLENIIKENATNYYTNGKQKLSDEVFDAAVDKIREENPNSEVLTTGWGYKPGSENKFRHRYCHIGSLKKARTFEEVENKLGKDFRYHISAKLDGLSCVLYYEEGLLQKALTRGDGEFGIDITKKVVAIDDTLAVLKDTKFTGAVRGEIFMTPKSFEEFKVHNPDAANARNSAAGLINSNEITEDYKYLSLYVYTVVAEENDNLFGVMFINNLYTWLEDNFKHVAPHVISSLMAEDCASENCLLAGLRDLYKEQVVIDGLVISNLCVPFNTEKHTYEYNQIAFKFDDEVKIATVKQIEWTASKHNAYIPVVVFEESIELEGTQVIRATGYNAKWIMDMGIKAGSVVAVRKSHQIIPEIIEVLS